MLLDIYRGKRVLVTGDTGFKGAWLVRWLTALGADVHGLALPPESPSLFEAARLAETIAHVSGDIQGLATVERALDAAKPDIVFHLAAQAIVRESYRDPLGTFMVNVMGTAHVCDALRRGSRPCALVVITSDKCYENHEWEYAFRENDALGGADPYSASKGAAEIVTSSWRRSFFPPEQFASHRRGVASARAGNVIGPGDWAKDRIVPDAIRALGAGNNLGVRNPNAIRPWQHVLEPLAGYLCLGAKLLSAEAPSFLGAWNFGPLPGNVRPVRELADAIIAAWGTGAWHLAGEANAPAEANFLRLAIDKAVAALAWSPVWDFRQTIERTVHGYRALAAAPGAAEARRVLDEEIAVYTRSAAAMGVKWAS